MYANHVKSFYISWSRHVTGDPAENGDPGGEPEGGSPLQESTGRTGQQCARPWGLPNFGRTPKHRGAPNCAGVPKESGRCLEMPGTMTYTQRATSF